MQNLSVETGSSVTAKENLFEIDSPVLQEKAPNVAYVNSPRVFEQHIPWVASLSNEQVK